MTVARGALLVSMLAWCPRAFALNPALDVNQYAHTAWKIRDGFTKGEISSIAQTPDGYLWLGTEFGLLRFDGVKTVAWQPPPDQHLPSTQITRLLVARDGTLWIGTVKGLASSRDGTLSQYPELAGTFVGKLVEDREGSIWAGGYKAPSGKLCAVRKGSVRCEGDGGELGLGVLGLYEDANANLWVGVSTGLWRWKPGPPQFYSLSGEANGIQGLAEDDAGALLISTHDGVRRLVAGKTEMAYPFPPALQQIQAHKVLRDRDGGLWIGTSGWGLLHLHGGRTDVFTQNDGLSGDLVHALFEDRERNVWVATSNGLDRFRDSAVATFSMNQGLSNDTVTSVLAAADGSIWIGTLAGLNRWNHGQVTIYRERSGPTRPGVREVVGPGLPDLGVHALFQDDRGRIWLSTRRGVGYLENDRLISIDGVPGGNFNAIAEDSGGNVWIANNTAGLLRVSASHEIQQIPWARLGSHGTAIPVVTDRARGGLWMGFVDGGVVHLVDDEIQESYTTADALGEGVVNRLQFDRDGTLWAATEGGLSRLKNGRVATLTSKNGLPCDGAHWVAEDNGQNVWMLTPCGLLRIARSELDAWAAAADTDRATTRTVHAMVFDSSDGVRITVNTSTYNPQAARSADGTLWFATTAGVSVVDPEHLPFNGLPPPVHVERITVDRTTYDATAGANGQLRLPPLVRDLAIDYTALSFVAPEKMRFRYKLEGFDSEWQDAGNRRQAFYNNLSPRRYRFRVSASNNSGVWNEAGAFLDFTVAPAYYQTTWFRVSSVAAALALLAAVYRLRLQQVARRFNIRFEERVNERTRIARDLHDTLLQSFQGVLLNFHAVTFLLPPGADKARATLDAAMERASRAITDGRDAVEGLRASTAVTSNLGRSINAFGEELGDGDGGHRPGFRVNIEGTPRDLAQILGDEVYRIAAEALRNAFRHAHATQIEVDIRYDRRQFRLRVRDDGRGIEPGVLAGRGYAGHFGLIGMRERATLAGGTLAIWSDRDSGTEIELTVPASVAYARHERTI